VGEANVPVLFVSHASRDDAFATAIESWLAAKGFDDVFVDHTKIAGGERWREALRASVGACRVVLLLVSPAWLDSEMCFAEFNTAWLSGKRIIPLFLLPQGQPLDEAQIRRLASIRAEDQGLDIMPCVGGDGSLDLDRDTRVAGLLEVGLRAAGASNRIGLDPEAFAIDKTQRPTPFPGLASFGDDDADAALFFGRSREIAETMEWLRQIRATGGLQPLFILGASGAGKSSLLKAGIVPRLRHQRPAWLPLRVFRPGADPLLNFAEAIARTGRDFGLQQAHGEIRDRLLDAWRNVPRPPKGELESSALSALEATLEEIGEGLRSAANLPRATVLIGIDQAEEMARTEGEGGEALADYLRAALSSRGSLWQLALTIRTDRFPELQSHPRFQNLQARGYDLRAIPVFRFESVVERPAGRYGVSLDPAVVDALMEDAPREDALPLLAFALQRLWHQYAASGRLTKANYDRVGGLKGLIEDAAERALAGIEPERDVPRPAGKLPKSLDRLGADTFVPALAQVNDEGATIRRVAAWASLGAEAQALLDRFDHWRLVVRKGIEVAGGTVEVAHEALFREWGRLKGWLEPERVRLEALRSLQLDAGNWERNGKDKGFLNHREVRLADARRLSGNASYAKRLIKRDFDYLGACQAAEREAVARARRGKAFVGLLVLALGGVGWWYEKLVREQYFRFTAMGIKALSASQERALKAKQEFKECLKGCPTMIVIPAGKFVMGSRHFSSAGPQHEVTIAQPFAISKFTVTFAEWDACVSAAACPTASDSGWGRNDRPAINVSWEEVQQYVAWLSRSTGKTYRLLSEAEWEYSARAGSTTAYWWGDDIGEDNANCDGCKSQWDNKQTAPVGSFKPNAFGLYDMHGNVWQWTEDPWHANYKDVPEDGSVWVMGGDASRRVVRGGSWINSPQSLLSAIRDKSTTVNGYFYLGFRVARSLNP
jgi:formylglycine-generating enzyme required for sulfatase activity